MEKEGGQEDGMTDNVDGDEPSWSPSPGLTGRSKSGAEDGDGDGDQAKPRHRQTLLTFNKHGQLAAFKPPQDPRRHSDEVRMRLKQDAMETRSLLPGLLATRPDVRNRGYLYKDGDAPILNMKYCPGLGPTRIRVMNADSIDAALTLRPAATNNKRYPCILNMANAESAGGGWLRGALAQEEALCYRTSLSQTLKKHYYPLPDRGGIYSPYVLVIRDNLRSGHGLLDLTNPAALPVVSTVSVAAVCMPSTTTDANGVHRYTLDQDRRLMKEKMRVILRIAAKNGHRQLVLGAFGCGAFANPRQEVAKMWASVLTEPEFAGGWWTDVLFAILDDGKGNLQTFKDELDGLMI